MIAYDLRHGLDLQKETFGSGSETSQHFITSDNFAPLQEGDPIIAETHIAAGRPLFLPNRYANPRLTAMSMRDRANDALLFGMAWGADFEHPIGEASIACVAKQMPDSRIVSWNAFGQGSRNPSSRIDRAAIKYARQTGSFDEVGREYAKRLGRLVNKNEHIDLFGASEGARIVLAMARYFARPVRNVTLFDAPGTLGDEVSFYDYAVRRFMTDEGKHSDTYAGFSQDNQMKKFLTEEDKDPKMIARKFTRHLFRGVALDHYYRTVQAMRQNGLEADLRLAAPFISGKLGFLLPVYTRVNDADRVRESLDASRDDFAGTELALWSIDGTHAIMNAGNMVQAALLAYAAKN